MFHPQNEAGTSGRDPLFLTYEIKDLTVSKSIFRKGRMFHAGIMTFKTLRGSFGPEHYHISRD